VTAEPLARVRPCPATDRAEDHVWDCRDIDLRDGTPCVCGRFETRLILDGRFYYVERERGP
jgi:hypothetical protein